MLLVFVFCFSISFSAFAEESETVLTVSDLSDSRLNVSGNSSLKDGVLTIPANGTFSAFIRVKPIAASRKYKFTFYYGCSSAVGSSFSLAGSVRIYYKDSSTSAELDILSLSKFTNSDMQRSNILTMPNDYGDSGRIYFVFKNTSASAVSIRIDNFVVNDMTTAELDSSLNSSLGKLGDRIKGFFEDLTESIKGFFIPSDGFFEGVKDKFDILLSEHLGFLYEAPALVVDIFSIVSNWNPPEQPTITLPAFNFPIAGHQVHLWDEQNYTFDFLSNQPWSTLYAFYKTFIFVLLSVAMINLAIDKYHNIIGGGSGDN